MPDEWPEVRVQAGPDTERVRDLATGKTFPSGHAAAAYRRKHGIVDKGEVWLNDE